MRVRTQAIIVLIFTMLYAFPASASPDIDFPMNGQSYGGKVRSGPGMNFKQIGSLGEGDSIVILNDAGAMMNGYSWFQISYRNGKRGYQWGGIICSDKAYNGIYRQCSVDLNSEKGNEITGYNLTEIEYNGGAFISNSDGTWTERSVGGANFTFNVQHRDGSSVYLQDTSRNVFLQLDLSRMEVMYAEGNGPQRSLYQITRAWADN